MRNFSKQSTTRETVIGWPQTRDRVIKEAIHYLKSEGFCEQPPREIIIGLPQKDEKTDVDTTRQLKDVVDRSAYSNRGIMYDGEDGTPVWQWRDWKGFLNPIFKTLKGISSYQHFRFSSQNPGIVYVKRGADDNEIQISILRDPAYRFRDSSRPVVIPPAGLTDQRATYLYRNIRPYVRPCYRDVTCPAPIAEE